MTLEDYIVSEDMPIIEVMKKIDKNASGNAFVCKNNILLGVVTDGDIRRNIVKQIDMKTPIKKIANYNPVRLSESESRNATALMKKFCITAIPIVDIDNCIIDIKFLLKDTILIEKKLNIPVVIMAGGKGTRLKPYTDILPKPLIPVGDKTITEHIMEQFEKYGCTNFDMVVNYKKNFIKSYFADSDIKRDIIFTEEEKYLGTGGGIALVKENIQGTFFLTNCDILVDTDYTKLLERHQKQENIITIVCAKKKVVIPYGTVEIDENGGVMKFQEKPSFEFKTSTGLYVIEPKFFEKIPKDTFIDITDIIQKCIDDKEKVGTYLIEEVDWMDMGQMEELEKMKEKLGM